MAERQSVGNADVFRILISGGYYPKVAERSPNMTIKACLGIDEFRALVSGVASQEHPSICIAVTPGCVYVTSTVMSGFMECPTIGTGTWRALLRASAVLDALPQVSSICNAYCCVWIGVEHGEIEFRVNLRVFGSTTTSWSM